MHKFKYEDIEPLRFNLKIKEFICNGIVNHEQALSFCAFNGLKTIVVCPAIMRYSNKKIIELISHKKVLLLNEHRPQSLSLNQLESDFVIINHEQLEKYRSFLTHHKFDAVILFCSEFIRNLNSKRSQLVFEYFSACPRRFCTTDSPFKDAGQMYYLSQLKFLKPDFYNEIINIIRPGTNP